MFTEDDLDAMTNMRDEADAHASSGDLMLAATGRRNYIIASVLLSLMENAGTDATTKEVETFDPRIDDYFRTLEAKPFNSLTPSEKAAVVSGDPKSDATNQAAMEAGVIKFDDPKSVDIEQV